MGRLEHNDGIDDRIIKEIKESGLVINDRATDDKNPQRVVKDRVKR